MNRLLFLSLLAGCLTITTGCLHHQTRSNFASCSSQTVACGECETGGCGDSCQSCNGGRMGGLLSKVRGRMGGCNAGCGGRVGCPAGPLGWQQGGLDYSSHLNPGFLGHNAGKAVNSQPFTPGAPTAQVAYPYYTHRGPRDFLSPNPMPIGP